MADFDNTRSFQFKPDFDMCLARIYAWYEQRIITGHRYVFTTTILNTRNIVQ